MAKSTKAKRWVEIAEQIKDALPGQWSIRGRGLRTCVVREPIKWLFACVGCGVGSRGTTRLFACVKPLFEPGIELTLTYGLLMDEVLNAPKTIDFTDVDAAHVAVEFATGPAQQKINQYTMERLAEIAEMDFAASPEIRSRGLHRLRLPGWRVILETDSPEHPAEMALAWAKDASNDEFESYFAELLTRWRSDGRIGALTFLKEHRERALANVS